VLVLASLVLSNSNLAYCVRPVASEVWCRPGRLDPRRVMLSMPDVAAAVMFFWVSCAVGGGYLWALFFISVRCARAQRDAHLGLVERASQWRGNCGGSRDWVCGAGVGRPPR